MGKLTLLLVIHDNIECRQWLNRHMLERLQSRYDVIVASPVNCDERFLTEYAQLGVHFLNYWPMPKKKDLLALLARLFYRLRTLLFFRGFQDYESVLQKWYIRNMGIEWLYKHYNSLRKKRKKLLVLIYRILFFDLCTSMRHFDDMYDVLLLGRTDAEANIYFKQDALSKKAKVINVIRNYDTLTCKGPFAVSGDMTLAFDRLCLFGIEDLIPKPFYKETYILNNFNLFYKAKLRREGILIATCQQDIMLNEAQMIAEFITNFSAYRITLRVHPNDFGKYDTFISDHVDIEEHYYQTYKSYDGSVLTFPNQHDNAKYYESLQSKQMILSSISTILMDAYILNVPTHLINCGSPECNIIQSREHIVLMREQIENKAPLKSFPSECIW